MVVLPDENAVMRLFPNDTPETVIGKKIKIRDLNFEIIGVLKNSSTTISYGNMIMASVPYTAMTLRLSPDRRINIASMIAFKMTIRRGRNSSWVTFYYIKGKKKFKVNGINITVMPP